MKRHVLATLGLVLLLLGLIGLADALTPQAPSKTMRFYLHREAGADRCSGAETVLFKKFDSRQDTPDKTKFLVDGKMKDVRTPGQSLGRITYVKERPKYQKAGKIGGNYKYADKTYSSFRVQEKGVEEDLVDGVPRSPSGQGGTEEWDQYAVGQGPIAVPEKVAKTPSRRLLGDRWEEPYQMMTCMLGMDARPDPVAADFGYKTADDFSVYSVSGLWYSLVIGAGKESDCSMALQIFAGVEDCMARENILAQSVAFDLDPTTYLGIREATDPFYVPVMTAWNDRGEGEKFKLCFTFPDFPDFPDIRVDGEFQMWDGRYNYSADSATKISIQDNPRGNDSKEGDAGYGEIDWTSDMMLDLCPKDKSNMILAPGQERNLYY